MRKKIQIPGGILYYDRAEYDDHENLLRDYLQSLQFANPQKIRDFFQLPANRLFPALNDTIRFIFSITKQRLFKMDCYDEWEQKELERITPECHPRRITLVWEIDGLRKVIFWREDASERTLKIACAQEWHEAGKWVRREYEEVKEEYGDFCTNPQKAEYLYYIKLQQQDEERKEYKWIKSHFEELKEQLKDRYPWPHYEYINKDDYPYKWLKPWFESSWDIERNLRQEPKRESYKNRDFPAIGLLLCSAPDISLPLPRLIVRVTAVCLIAPPLSYPVLFLMTTLLPGIETQEFFRNEKYSPNAIRNNLKGLSSFFSEPERVTSRVKYSTEREDGTEPPFDIYDIFRTSEKATKRIHEALQSFVLPEYPCFSKFKTRPQLEFAKDPGKYRSGYVKILNSYCGPVKSYSLWHLKNPDWKDCKPVKREHVINRDIIRSKASHITDDRQNMIIEKLDMCGARNRIQDEFDRRLFRLYYMYGYTQEELALLLDYSQSEISDRLKRINNLLFDILNKPVNQCPPLKKFKKPSNQEIAPEFAYNEIEPELSKFFDQKMDIIIPNFEKLIKIYHNFRSEYIKQNNLITIGFEDCLNTKGKGALLGQKALYEYLENNGILQKYINYLKRAGSSEEISIRGNSFKDMLQYVIPPAIRLNERSLLYWIDVHGKAAELYVDLRCEGIQKTEIEKVVSPYRFKGDWSIYETIKPYWNENTEISFMKEISDGIKSYKPFQNLEGWPNKAEMMKVEETQTYHRIENFITYLCEGLMAHVYNRWHHLIRKLYKREGKKVWDPWNNDGSISPTYFEKRMKTPEEYYLKNMHRAELLLEQSRKAINEPFEVHYEKEPLKSDYERKTTEEDWRNRKKRIIDEVIPSIDKRHLEILTCFTDESYLLEWQYIDKLWNECPEKLPSSIKHDIRELLRLQENPNRKRIDPLDEFSGLKADIMEKIKGSSIWKNHGKDRYDPKILEDIDAIAQKEYCIKRDISQESIQNSIEEYKPYIERRDIFKSLLCNHANNILFEKPGYIDYEKVSEYEKYEEYPILTNEQIKTCKKHELSYDPLELFNIEESRYDKASERVSDDYHGELDIDNLPGNVPEEKRIEDTSLQQQTYNERPEQRISDAPEEKEDADELEIRQEFRPEGKVFRVIGYEGNASIYEEILYFRELYTEEWIPHDSILAALQSERKPPLIVIECKTCGKRYDSVVKENGEQVWRFTGEVFDGIKRGFCSWRCYKRHYRLKTRRGAKVQITELPAPDKGKRDYKDEIPRKNKGRKTSDRERLEAKANSKIISEKFFYNLIYTDSIAIF